MQRLHLKLYYRQTSATAVEGGVRYANVREVDIRTVARRRVLNVH